MVTTRDRITCDPVAMKEGGNYFVPRYYQGRNSYHYGRVVIPLIPWTPGKVVKWSESFVTGKLTMKRVGATSSGRNCSIYLDLLHNYGQSGDTHVGYLRQGSGFVCYLCRFKKDGVEWLGLEVDKRNSQDWIQNFEGTFKLSTGAVQNGYYRDRQFKPIQVQYTESGREKINDSEIYNSFAYYSPVASNVADANNGRYYSSVVNKV